MVHAGDRRVARRRRVDEQHVPRQRPTVRQSHLGVRPGVLQAETLAQAAERGGKKVAQIEWAGGRSGASKGRRSTSATSGPVAVSRRTTSAPSIRHVHAAFGLQFDHPAGFAGQPAFPQAAPVPATGWTNVPKSYSPPMEMRLRVIDGTGGDKYGLNAYIYDSKRDRHHQYDRVLFSFTKDGNDEVADLKEGQWADVKVTINGGTNFPTDPLNGKTGAMLIKVERLEGRPLPGPAVPHVGDTGHRHVAELAG